MCIKVESGGQMKLAVFDLTLALKRAKQNKQKGPKESSNQCGCRDIVCIISSVQQCRPIRGFDKFGFDKFSAAGRELAKRLKGAGQYSKLLYKQLSSGEPLNLGQSSKVNSTKNKG